MTIASEIQRIQTNIVNAYTSLEAKGATMPDTRNSANLASTIDSVPSTGSDTVQAFALGEVKNAVEGNKVSLNFSANMAAVEPEITYSTSTSRGGHVFSINKGEYIYCGSEAYSRLICYKRNSSGNYSTSTEVNINIWANGGEYYFSGIYTSGATVYQVLSGNSTVTLSSKNKLNISPDGKVVTCVGSGAVDIFVKQPNGIFAKLAEGFVVNNTTTGKSYFNGFAIYPSEDGVLYKLLTLYGGASFQHKLFEFNSITGEVKVLKDVSTPAIAQTGIIYNGFLITTNYYGDFNVFEELSEGVYTLNPAFSSQVTGAAKKIISSSSTARNILSILDDYLVLGTDDNSKNVRLQYEDSKGFTEVPSPFSDKNGGYTRYFDGGIAIWSPNLARNTNFEVRRTILPPVEQPYVAMEPVSGNFYADQTLTGIVQENDNGILKVSTVEDPNNPPPAIPDEAGLSVTPFYGTPKKLLNGTASGSLTVSDDASVSGFTTSDSNLVYTDNPFLQILEESEPVINTFEIVIPFTMGTYDDNWLFTLRSSTSGSGQSIANYFQVNSSDKLNFYSTSSPSLSMVGTTTLTSNTKYWVKFTYDATEGYKILLSTNGSDYTIEASSATTTLLNVNYKYLIFGNNLTQSSTSYNWSGTIHFDGAYININGRQYWKGSKSDFGSVGIGYGYFHNTLSTPTDKYVAYNGGILTEDNISGSKATIMNIILGRTADEGSWTSDTEGYLSAQDTVITGVNKKLSTPVYLWHDLSYITPVVPETIEPEVVVRKNNAQVLQDFTTTGVTVDEQAKITGFNSGAKYMAYIDSPLYNKEVSSINWWFSFTTGASVTSYDRTICGFYNSVSSGDVNGFFLKTNSSGQICFGNSTSSTTYLATGSTTLSASTRYIVHITYSTSAGYTVIIENGSDGSVVETLTASTTVITTAPYLVFGCNAAAESTNYNWNGLIELASYYITVDGTTTYFAVPFTGTVSLPSSWKTLDGVVYEYPNGFPETQGKDLMVGDILVGNYNNLYVTRTGDSCGMAISSTSPSGVDSSAILGTVFIGGSRDILKYTPGE